jgi:hypothetical protein
MDHLLKQQQKINRPGLVIYTCEHRDSGGKDQEDHGSKPAQAK